MGALRGGGNSDIRTAISRGNSSGGLGAIAGAQPTDNLENDMKRGTREAWYYRRSRIPEALPYRELRFDFISKEGYGTGVMQKDAQPMQALGQVADLERKEKALH